MSKFKIGDRVRIGTLVGHIGYLDFIKNEFGTVVGLIGDPLYPIEVKWGNGNEDVFTESGWWWDTTDGTKPNGRIELIDDSFEGNV